MKPSILLTGAFDRFNFGDLLFPLITREGLRRLGVEAEFDVFATRRSDLSAAGALPTKSLQELYRSAPSPGDTLLLAGGEILDARWSGTWSALTTPGRAWWLKLLSKGLPAVADSLGRRVLSGPGPGRPLPWVFGPEDVGDGVRVAYNAVGGSGVHRLAPAFQEALRRRLDGAAFLSVRDPRTQETLGGWKLACPVRLAPDPAALMAEVFPTGWLERHQSREARDIRARFAEGGYLVVQLGRYAARGRGPEIARELRRLHRSSGLAVVLVPLGQAAGHDDRQALARLQTRLSGLPTILASAATIFDILALIAGSRFFAGTSLHGNLTALAYRVPRVGLGPRIRKLDLLLRTWDTTQGEGCAPFGEFADRAQQQLSLTPDVLEGSSRRVVGEAWRNLEDLATTLQWLRPPT